MRIIFVTFGEDLSNYNQACFCILSSLKEPHPPQINVITDRPALFRYLGDSIEIDRLSRQKLDQWMGPAGFFWRFKIKAIMSIIRRYPGEHILFLDADTFISDGLHELNAQLEKAKPVMHEFAGNLGEIGGKRYNSMLAGFNNKTFCGIKIDADSEVWNAGVVGIPGPKSMETIQLALDLCDEMCATNVRRAYLEQFALSLALKEINGPIIPADRWIGHYWGNKSRWNEEIISFFLQSKFENRTLEQDLTAIQSFDYTKIPLRMKRQKKWVVRLERALKRHFPMKAQLYHPNK